MGTDYNPYHPTSPIHIRHFNDILRILNVKQFEDIDEDILLANIYMIMKNNESNPYCKQTAVALNMYLNDIENELHYITKDIDVTMLNKERFLKYSKQIIYT